MVAPATSSSNFDLSFILRPIRKVFFVLAPILLIFFSAIKHWEICSTPSSALCYKTGSLFRLWLFQMSWFGLRWLLTKFWSTTVLGSWKASLHRLYRIVWAKKLYNWIIATKNVFISNNLIHSDEIRLVIHLKTRKQTIGFSLLYTIE